MSSALPKVVLQSVVRVSDTSIFLTPREGESLDFRTINSAPPAHRAVLQRHGLIAKVCIGLLSTSSEAANGTVDDVYSAEGRRELWLQALIHGKLLSHGTESLSVPPAFANDLWPLLTEKEFDARMASFSARLANEEVNTSSYCVPAIAIQQFTYRTTKVRAAVGVVWMPRYAQSLTAWATERLAATSKPLAESHLLTMLQHVTVGVAAMGRTVTAKSHGATAAADTHCAHPTGMQMDSILVHETDGQPIFCVALSPLAMTARQREVAANLSTSRFKQLNLLPYLAPEQVRAQPVTRAPRFAVWALGAIALALGGGTPTIASQLKSQRARKPELPLNHPSLTPDAVVARVRRDLAPGGYSAGFIALVGLLLSQDDTTRPALRTVDKMLQDLNRSIPVHRFPFALGDLSLLRVPQPELVQLNPSAHKYATKDACCLCKGQRNKTNCKNREHAPAMVSPYWEGDEPLPEFFAPTSENAASTVFLYPLVPNGLEDKERKKLLTVAVQGPKATRHGADGVSPKRSTIAGTDVNASAVTVNTSVGSTAFSNGATMILQDNPTVNPSLLFQLFGGFAVYEKRPSEPVAEPPATAATPTHRKDRATVTEVVVPFPSKALRKSEAPLAVGTLKFTAALPWPSACTKVLQRKGRVCAPVPPIFGGLAGSSGSAATSPTGAATAARDLVPKYFAWIAPNERFPLESGHYWTPAPEGGFVFWFNDNLEPSDMDRYFAVTSVRSCTLNDHVQQTVLPDQIFRKHIGDDSFQNSTMYHTMGFSNLELPSRHQTPRGMSTSTAVSSAPRRRGSLSIANIEVPTGKAIYEEEPELAPQYRSHTQSRAPSPGLPRPLTGEVERRRSTRSTRTVSSAQSVHHQRNSSSIEAHSKTMHPQQQQAPALTSYEDFAAVTRKGSRSPSNPRGNSKEKELTATATVGSGEEGITSRAGSNDTQTTTTTVKSDTLTSGLGASSEAFNGTQTRRSRRTISPSQRKERMAAPRMDAVEDVDCTTPIVERAAAKRRAVADNGNHKKATNSPLQDKENEARSAPPAPTLLPSTLSRLPSKKKDLAVRGSTESLTQASAPAPSRLTPLAVNSKTTVHALKQRAATASAATPSQERRKTTDALAKPVETEPTGATVALPLVPRRRSDTVVPSAVTTTSAGAGASTPAETTPMIRRSSFTEGEDRRTQLPRRTSAPKHSMTATSTALVLATATAAPVSVPYISLAPLVSRTSANHYTGTPTELPCPPVAAVSLFGRWLPADMVDAPFDSLTFYVPTTHEHGTLQSPVAVTETARATLHCPADAEFMSFMSNEAPLIGRNHNTSHGDRDLLFPHHGFVFYAANGAVVAALAVRCGPAGSVDMEPEDEFPIIGKPMPARMGIAAASRHYYASYFTLADTPRFLDSLMPAAMQGPLVTPRGRHLRHINKGGPGQLPPSTPQDPQMLTFSSARRLVGEFTPADSPAATELLTDGGERPSRCDSRLALLDLDPDTLLPVCWMGYDLENGALVLASVDQSVWYPIVIC